MPGFLTAAGESYLLDLITQSSGAYQQYFIALGLENPPSRHMLGDEFDEPITPDYARAVYDNQSGNWTDRIGSVSNTLEIAFPVCTEAWGTIKHWAIMTDAEGGQLLWAGSFLTPVSIYEADQLVLPPGALTLQTTGYVTSVSL